MRRGLVIAASVLLLCGVAGAATLQFSNADAASGFIPFTGGGAIGSVLPGWDVVLCLDNGDMSFTWGTDGIVAVTDLWSSTPGYYLGNYDSGPDLYYWAVCLNTLDYTSVAPTHYAVGSLSPGQMPASGNGSINFGGGGNWQPVPEPGTVALFALGIAVIALHKKRAS